MLFLGIKQVYLIVIPIQDENVDTNEKVTTEHAARCACPLSEA